jgi:hypothetical protein
MKRLTLLAACGLALCVAACSSGDKPATEDSGIPLILGKYPHSSTGLPKSNECVFMAKIDSWTELDDYTLIIYAPNGRTPYLVQTAGPCPGLRYSTAIAISEGVSGRLCSYGGGAIVLSGSNAPNRCSVGAIHKITMDEAKQVRQEFRDGMYRR